MWNEFSRSLACENTVEEGVKKIYCSAVSESTAAQPRDSGENYLGLSGQQGSEIISTIADT